MGQPIRNVVVATQLRAEVAELRQLAVQLASQRNGQASSVKVAATPVAEGTAPASR